MEQITTSLISALIGGIIVAVVENILDKRKEIDINKNRITEEKYRSLLIFMACALDISKKRYFLLNEQIENKTKEDYLNQIIEYYYHSILYSSDNVILSLEKFIQEPNKDNYIKTAKAMREELWENKTKLKYEDILINHNL